MQQQKVMQNHQQNSIQEIEVLKDADHILGKLIDKVSQSQNQNDTLENLPFLKEFQENHSKSSSYYSSNEFTESQQQSSQQSAYQYLSQEKNKKSQQSKILSKSFEKSQLDQSVLHRQENSQLSSNPNNLSENSQINESDDKFDQISGIYNSRIDSFRQQQNHKEKSNTQLKCQNQDLLCQKKSKLQQKSTSPLVTQNNKDFVDLQTDSFSSIDHPTQIIQLSSLSQFSNLSITLSGYQDRNKINSINSPLKYPKEQYKKIHEESLEVDNSSLEQQKKELPQAYRLRFEYAKEKRQKIKIIAEKKNKIRDQAPRKQRQTQERYRQDKQEQYKRRAFHKQFESNPQIKSIVIEQNTSKEEEENFDDRLKDFYKRPQQIQKSTNRILILPAKKEALNKILNDNDCKQTKNDVQKFIRHPNNNQEFSYRIPKDQYFQYEVLVLSNHQINVHRLVEYQWKNLIYLNLRNCSLHDQGVLVLTMDICQFPDLQHLDLSQNNITDHGAKFIATYLPRTNYLIDLRLQNNRITHQGLNYILDQKTQLNFLCKLNMNLNHVGDQGFINLCQSHQSIPKILNIKFNENSLTALSMKSLFKYSEYFTKLKEINLQKNYIGDDGAQYLSKAFCNFSVLKFIYLDQNNISSKGFSFIASNVSQLQKLQVLHLNANRIWSIENSQFNELEKASQLRQVDLRLNPLNYNRQFSLSIITQYCDKMPKFKLLLNSKSNQDFSNMPLDFSTIIRLNQKFGIKFVSRLDLSGCKLTDQDWRYFVQNSFKLTEIIYLKLDNNFIETITEQDITKILKFISQRKNNTKWPNPHFQTIIEIAQLQNQSKQEHKKVEQFVEKGQKRAIRKYHNKKKEETNFIEISLINNKLCEESIKLILSLDKQKSPIKFIISETEKSRKTNTFRQNDFMFKLQKWIKQLIPSSTDVKEEDYVKKFLNFSQLLNTIKKNITQNNLTREFYAQIFDEVIKQRKKSDLIYTKLKQNEPDFLQIMKSKIMQLVDQWSQDLQKGRSSTILQSDIRQLVQIEQKICNKFMTRIKKVNKVREKQAEKAKQYEEQRVQQLQLLHCYYLQLEQYKT